MKGSFQRLGRTFLSYSVKIISLLLAVSVIAFVLVSFSPIDPVQQYILGLGTAVSPEQRAEIEEYWGVNEPPVERYFTWLRELLKGNWGESALYRRPVMDIISERFANSLALMLCAWVLSGLVGFFLGCVMGMYQDKWPDRILKKICYLLSSVPTFWLGLVFVLVFAVWLKWFPIGFSAPIGVTQEDVTLWQRLHHQALPAITLSLMSFANIALHTRQKLIDALTDALCELIQTVFKVLDTMERRAPKEVKVEVTFGEYANPSFEAVVETLSNPNTPMSIEAKVDELWGDGKDEDWKKAEVQRIYQEQGLAAVEEPAAAADLEL